MFLEVDLTKDSSQFASTMWFLSSKVDGEISRLWKVNSGTLENFNEFCSENELSEFRAHRHGQSLFQLS